MAWLGSGSDTPAAGQDHCAAGGWIDALGIVAGEIFFVAFVATPLIGCPNLLVVMN